MNAYDKLNVLIAVSGLIGILLINSDKSSKRFYSGFAILGVAVLIYLVKEFIF